ncbi:MAG: hypothetical protein GJU73_06815 [Ferrovum sp.]|jgi:hypothetical protein|uniref:hypothetical protein n=1 Tax=Ferrovum sp. TaxID=2609467 RepID=UPI00262DAD42|nr:hypothetical protein [Ferrovum sp.]MBW8067141.1 hypothetical protein [Ferrovum sp.]
MSIYRFGIPDFQYLYFDSGRSTGRAVSIIKVEAASKLCNAAGVMASFAGLLRNIGYASALPYPV